MRMGCVVIVAISEMASAQLATLAAPSKYAPSDRHLRGDIRRITPGKNVVKSPGPDLRLVLSSHFRND